MGYLSPFVTFLYKRLAKFYKMLVTSSDTSVLPSLGS
jgi:hypothetical protein